MAKGQESKDIIFNKLLEVFDGAFMADAKTLRIPMVENGETVEIKVVLTAAKDIMGGSDISAPVVSQATGMVDGFPEPVKKVEPIRATQEEKDNINKLMAELGL